MSCYFLYVWEKTSRHLQRTDSTYSEASIHFSTFLSGQRTQWRSASCAWRCPHHLLAESQLCSNYSNSTLQVSRELVRRCSRSRVCQSKWNSCELSTSEASWFAAWLWKEQFVTPVVAAPLESAEAAELEAFRPLRSCSSGRYGKTGSTSWEGRDKQV